MNPEDINVKAYEAYKVEVEKLEKVIEEMVPVRREGAVTVEGRKWCERNDIPEHMFADAVQGSENLTYGVSPMYPFQEP